MRFLTVLTMLIISLGALLACTPGSVPAVETGVPSALSTGAAQAPTVLPDAANTAAAAIQAAATEAARQSGTIVPSAATAASNAGTAVAPAAQTAASAAQTAVTNVAPAAETAAAAAQTAVATPFVVVPSAGTPPPGGRTVEVRLSEYKIDMPVTVPAGQVTFRVTNAGSTAHNFVVEGQGVEKKFDNDLKPGETNNLQVNLPAGSYRIYCPVDGHRDLGMQVNLVVTP